MDGTTSSIYTHMIVCHFLVLCFFFQEMARHLQDKERKRYELRLKEKELRRQRKMLEAELKRESNNLLGTQSIFAEMDEIF